MTGTAAPVNPCPASLGREVMGLPASMNRSSLDCRRRLVLPGQLRDPVALVGLGQVRLSDTLHRRPVEPPEAHQITEVGDREIHAGSLPRRPCRRPARLWRESAISPPPSLALPRNGHSQRGAASQLRSGCAV